jgi:hypothetical protein
LKVTDNIVTTYDKLPVEYLPDVEEAKVGQAVIITEVQDGKPTKWKAVDYQPRTHWTEEKVLVEGASDVDPEMGAATFEGTAKISVGETYKVNWGGMEYICEAVDGTALGESGAAALGNVAALTGSGDTGEPFVLLCAEGTVLAMPLDGSTSVTLSIVGKFNNPIPQKYMPEETLFGDRQCQKPVLDLKAWAGKYVAVDIFLPTDTTSDTVHNPTDEQYVNTELTKTHYEEVLNYFKERPLVYCEHLKATSKGEIQAFDDQQICIATFYGVDSTLTFYKGRFWLRWSDTENCVQIAYILQS